MDVWLKCDMVDGEESGCVGSNLTGGSEISEAMEGWEFAGGGFVGCAALVSRVLLLSELYITATFVEGEFIVPVRDQPIAVCIVSVIWYCEVIVGLTLAWMYHW